MTCMLASSLAKFVMDDQFQNGTQIWKSRFQEMVIIYGWQRIIIIIILFFEQVG